MNPVQQAVELLRDALEGVVGIRHYRLMSGPVDPPATVLAPPALQWQALGPDPTEATFRVALVVARDDRTVDQLIELYGVVVEALDGLDGRVQVRSAEPGVYPAGGVELPAYLFDVDVSLVQF